MGRIKVKRNIRKPEGPPAPFFGVGCRAARTMDKSGNDAESGGQCPDSSVASVRWCVG